MWLFEPISNETRAWTKLVAIATLVAIVTAAPVGAIEVQVRPDKNLTGGLHFSEALRERTAKIVGACPWLPRFLRRTTSFISASLASA
jgi:hypothetical protein